MVVLVAEVFKIVSLLILILGIIAAVNATSVENQFGASTSTQSGTVVYILAATAVASSVTAFFGYVLTLLRGIYLNTHLASTSSSL